MPTPLDTFHFTGWDQGFGDFLVIPDLDQVCMLPHRPGTALVFGTPVHDDTSPSRWRPGNCWRRNSIVCATWDTR
ncbi:hypothetical protein ACIRP3_43490 [Streptomyces sp. NPDC101209]|uniref:hypothetical protein n=1 Tax=Streptomyces sp. NPDC101209 TaxID=3366129 RepID=UPI0037F4B91F